MNSTVAVEVLNTKFIEKEKECVRCHADIDGVKKTVGEMYDWMGKQDQYNVKDKYKIEEFEAKLDDISRKIEKTGDFQITVKNGVEKDMWISQVVQEMYSYLGVFKKYSNDQLNEGLAAMVDLANDFKRIKKWKVLWGIGLLLLMNFFGIHFEFKTVLAFFGISI